VPSGGVGDYQSQSNNSQPQDSRLKSRTKGVRT
jgi:hypothetical protein